MNIMKKVLAISSVLLWAVFLAGCGRQPVNQTQPTAQIPVTQQSAPTAVTQPNQSAPVRPEIDKITGWQKFDYKNKGVVISVPRDWQNESAVEDHPLFVDANGKSGINVSFPGDEQAFGSSTGKAVVESYLSDPKGNRVVKEDLALGKNTVYKFCPSDDAKCLTTSTTYDIRLKNNIGFVEFSVSQDASQGVVKSILEKVETY
jgi:hypothetical protein